MEILWYAYRDTEPRVQGMNLRKKLYIYTWMPGTWLRNSNFPPRNEGLDGFGNMNCLRCISLINTLLFFLSIALLYPITISKAKTQHENTQYQSYIVSFQKMHIRLLMENGSIKYGYQTKKAVKKKFYKTK